MISDLIIVGAGGFAREVEWICLQSPHMWNLLGFVDDDASLLGKPIGSSLVIGTIDTLRDFPSAKIVLAIGTPRTRKMVRQRLSQVSPSQFATVVDPSFKHSPQVRLGHGCIICAGVVATVNVEIQDHCIVNLCSTIGHDSSIAPFCTIAPQVAISGNVTLEQGVEVGTSAAIRQGVRVGRGAMIGMGAIVLNDVDPNTCVAGNPARILKTLPEFEREND